MERTGLASEVIRKIDAAEKSEAMTELLHNLGSTALYVTMGLLFFGLAFWIMHRLFPFSIRKEIEEDQNTALGIVMGAVILGIAIIIAAAVHG